MLLYRLEAIAPQCQMHMCCHQPSPTLADQSQHKRRFALFGTMWLQCFYKGKSALQHADSAKRFNNLQPLERTREPWLKASGSFLSRHQVAVEPSNSRLERSCATSSTIACRSCSPPLSNTACHEELPNHVDSSRHVRSFHDLVSQTSSASSRSAAWKTAPFNPASYPSP